MARPLRASLAVCSLALATQLAAVAHPDAEPAAAPPAAAAPAASAPAAPPGGFQADLLRDYGGATEHLLQLAEAVPAEKYGWRPAEGVRSFSEVLTHVAAGNYMGAAALGAPVPAGVDPAKLEAIADKAQAVAALRGSVEHFQRAVAAAPAGSLDDQVELFGMKLSKRGVMLLMQGHAHEHTGQAIAYARMNGIVPPWSRPASGG